MVIQTNKESKRAKWGANPYVNLLACKGTMFCFVRSLKASRRGWTIPIMDTLLGPTRLWKRPITLRSKRVKKATDKRTKRQWTSQEMKIIKE